MYAIEIYNDSTQTWSVVYTGSDLGYMTKAFESREAGEPPQMIRLVCILRYSAAFAQPPNDENAPSEGTPQSASKIAPNSQMSPSKSLKKKVK